MPIVIEKPMIITAAGNKPKKIEEYIGKANSKTPEISIARMVSPSGWEEPGQRPEFAEYSIVLKGFLQVKTETGMLQVKAGQAIIVKPGEWVKYGTPGPDGAEYLSVCLPAFSPDTVHRDP